MHIGLIGGIGVAATRVYYTRLVAAIEHWVVPEITIVQAGDLVAITEKTIGPRSALSAGASAGCRRRCAAITSTAGTCFDGARARSPLPLVSAISPLDAWLAGEGLARVRLRNAHRDGSRLYGALEQTEAVVLEDELDAWAPRTRIRRLRAPVRQSSALLSRRRCPPCRDQGAEAVVLVGTDLGLAFDGEVTDCRVVDALDVHVKCSPASGRISTRVRTRACRDRALAIA